MTPSSGAAGSLGEAATATLVADEDILSHDDIPDENQQITCFSCGKKMKGLFCHHCGQKNDDYRRSIWSLFTETFASVFSLENRMWRTWSYLLLKPGSVAREFSDGKRIKWTSPVRIYLALSIFLFGYMSLTETRIFSIRTDIIPKAEFTGEVATLEDSSVRLVPKFGFFRRQAELDKLNSKTDFDRVTRLMKGAPRQVFVFNDDLTLLGNLPSNDLLKSSQSWPDDTPTQTNGESLETLRQQAVENYTTKVADIVKLYNGILFVASDQETIGTRLVEADQLNAPLNIAEELRFGSTEDVKTLTIDAIEALDQNLANLGLSRSLIHTLPIELRREFSFQLGSSTINGVNLSETDARNLYVQILQNPAILNEGISRYLPRIMFLMMPFAAIIGLVFIRGKKTALLYDHLVHATYIHAVTFAFLLILILLSQLTSLTGMIQLFFVGTAIYLPLSTKRMFNRGWFKTFFASYSIAIFYGLAMFVIVTSLTALSLSEIAEIGQR